MEDKQQLPTIRTETTDTTSDLSRLDQISANQSLDQPVTAVTQPQRPIVPEEQTQPLLKRSLNMAWKKVLIAGLALLVAMTGVGVFVFRKNPDNPAVKAGIFDTVDVPLREVLPTHQEEKLGQTLTVNGRLQVAESIIMSPVTLPVSGVTGQIVYDQNTNTLAYYNGTQFISLTGSGIAGGQGSTTNITTVIQGGGGGSALNGTPGQLAKFTGVDTVGNSIASDNGTTLRVDGNVNLVSTVTVPMSELTAFDPTDTPTLTDITDENQSLEVGIKFRTDVSGFVRGVRFYKGTLNTGTHTGSLWSGSGTLLATGTFTGETATGWQELRFPTPVAVSADTTYIASYHSAAYYSATPDFFKNSGVDNNSLHLLRDGDDGGNGVYNYGAGTIFPTRSSRSSNYFVDVIFLPNPPPNQYQINNVQIASADLANNSDIAKRSASQIFTGNNTFRPSVNSASSFSVQATDGTAQFTVSTSESRIYLGPSVGVDVDVTLLVLGNRKTVGDPVGVEGAIYYNSFLRSFRCYRSGIWDNCALPEVDHSFSAYEEFLGGQNTSFVTDSFGTLGWKSQAIGANGTVSYDPGTPTPVATRPGILALETPATANQGTTFLLGSGSGTLLLAKDNIMKTSVAVGSTSQVLRVGLHSQTTGTTQPLSGVWWEADASADPRWRYCSGDGAAVVCTASTVTITADTWARLELRILATGAGVSSFEAGINGTFLTKTGVSIDTTNRVSPAYSCYTTVAAAQNCYWDYYQLKGTTSVAR